MHPDQKNRVQRFKENQQKQIKERKTTQEAPITAHKVPLVRMSRIQV